MARSRKISLPITSDEPQSANAKVVDVVNQVSHEDGQTTSDALFPDFKEEALDVQANENSPTPVEEPKPQEEQKKDEPSLPIEPPVEPKTEVFDFDKIKGFKVKAKADGQEEEITIEEAVKRAQLKKHYDLEGQRIGQQRREIAEETRKLEELRNTIYRPPAQSESTEESIVSNDPLVMNLRKELEQAKAEIRSIHTSLGPTIVKTERQKIGEKLVAQGFSDGMEWDKKIDQYLGEITDPIVFQNELKKINDPITERAEGIFYMMKAREQSLPKPTPPVTPVANGYERIIPPIVKINGGTSSSTPITDESRNQANLNAAFKNYKETGDKNAMNEILRMKGVI